MVSTALVTSMIVFLSSFFVIQSASIEIATPQGERAESPVSIGAPSLGTPIDQRLLALNTFDSAPNADNHTIQFLTNQIRQMERELLNRDAIINLMKKSMHEKESEIERLQGLLAENRPVTVVRVQNSPRVPVALPLAGSQTLPTAASSPQTNAHRSLYKKGTNPVLYKTVLCNKFMAGGCSYGSRCKFAHGESELRSRQHNIYCVN